MTSVLSCVQVTVEVAGQTKGTAATEGQSNPDWEETLEFAVGGDAAEDDEAQARSILIASLTRSHCVPRFVLQMLPWSSLLCI